MAYIVLNNENSLSGIAKNDTDLNCVTYVAHYKNNIGGKVINISDEDFNALVDGTKVYESCDGTNVTLADPVRAISYSSQEDLQDHINNLINVLNEKKYATDSSLQTKKDAFVTYLQSLNLSTITYPLNQTLNSYCRSQGQEPFSYLQLL
jgi:hypothetical protein